MLKTKKMKGIKVETFVLVAIWEIPFIFQGCFKITELCGERAVLYFFRCQSSHLKKTDILHVDFSPEQYELTHLYHQSGLISLNNLNQAQEDAIYLLKYALHVTLSEMLSNRNVHFTTIDDVAMQAFINKVKPILNQEVSLLEDDHIGFAVVMDFCPEEKTASVAALTLLSILKKE